MRFAEHTTLCLGTAVLAWLCGFGLRWLLLRCGVLDIPNNETSSHLRPTPRGGGLLIIGAFFGWYLLVDHGNLATLAIDWLALGVAAVAVISFLDDIRSQSRRLRLLICSLAGAVFLAALLPNLFSLSWGPAPLIVMVLWLLIVGYSNAFNFIDGINGLAGMQAVIALLAGAALCASRDADELVVLQLILAGAMIGFLAHNLFSGRLFLGDVGSITSGYLLAVITILIGVELGWQAGIAMAALHLGPTLDASITLWRRFRRGDVVYQRHRDFFFHRAVRAGRSHIFVTVRESMIQVASAILIGGALRFSSSFWPVVAAIAVSVILWLAFFFWCERQFTAFCSHHRRAGK